MRRRSTGIDSDRRVGKTLGYLLAVSVQFTGCTRWRQCPRWGLSPAISNGCWRVVALEQARSIRRNGDGVDREAQSDCGVRRGSGKPGKECPPFSTGSDFSFQAEVPPSPEGDEDDSPSTFTKLPSVIDQKAYRDTWGLGLDGYAQWFYEAVIVLCDLLAETGSMYVHCDYRADALIRMILTEVFCAVGAWLEFQCKAW